MCSWAGNVHGNKDQQEEQLEWKGKEIELVFNDLLMVYKYLKEIVRLVSTVGGG